MHRGGHDRAQLDIVVKHLTVLPTSEVVARRAGELMAHAGLDDAVDAIVAAEALLFAPAVVLTTDVEDIRTLLDDQPGAKRVEVIRVDG